ncbi:MAG: phosphoribosylanthranilate isomerase [Brevundimonas sp.]|uniref:phosphoribosylanthranilate isomerase n=1 Tax=Brevundimonas sp. TaxID=1871086 RepID=UPI003919F96F
MKVKICGLTRPELLTAAAEAGVDFIGVVAYPRSHRHVAPMRAAALLEEAGMITRRPVPVVAVTVDASDALLDAIMTEYAPQFIQLHGQESPGRAEAVRRLTGAGVIKCVPVSTRADIEGAHDFEGVADYLLFDARTPEGSSLPGGMGVSFDWTMMAGRSFSVPWFLAGGLDAANVAAAVAASGARMVDVSSGVESAPGVKDADLIRAFIGAARAADPQGTGPQRTDGDPS